MADDNKDSKVHLNKPSEYDGSAGWEGFLLEVLLYVNAYPKAFTTDVSKIIFILSFMTKGTAKSWAEHARKEALYDPGTKKYRTAPVFGTWSEFVEKATKRFGNHNAQADADRKLQSLWQGSKSAQEFFQEFDELSTLAGYIGDQFDALRINLIKQHANDSLVVEILKMENVPTEYSKWKEIIIRIDDQVRAHRQERREKTLTKPAFRLPFRPQPPRPTAPVQKHIEGTYAGKGTGVAPMEGLDVGEMRKKGLCFRCGKAGHLARNCPDAPRRIRQLIDDMEPEDRYDLAELIGSLPESEFDCESVEAIQARGMAFADEEDTRTPPESSFSPTEQ